MLIALLQFVLLVVSALDYPSPPHQMNSDLENQDTDYIFPSHHQIREHPTEDEEYFQRAPLVEHPFYNKQVYEPPEYSQRIPDEIFGEVPQADTARCYSCMSKFYEGFWPAISHVYKRPLNFTDDCNDENIDQKRVPFVHCPNICVSMSEETSIAGVKVKGSIRGCFDEMLLRGFNQTVVTWFRWMIRDGCHVYRKRELFKLTAEQSDESTIQVCTCYSDYCTNSSIRELGPLLFLILSVFGSLFLV